jgi:enoyl-CoA hydratase/carnithine racemase
MRAVARSPRRRSPKAPERPLLAELRGGIAWLTLNRPQQGNAINQRLAAQLMAAVEEIQLDDAVRLVVIEGRGKHFCTGIEGNGAWQHRQGWVAAVGGLRPPVIAAIHGDALAEGCELALACDLRLVSMRARFRLPQLQEGKLPRHGGTQRLPRLVGRMRALDLLLTGRWLRAAEAEEIGLASRRLPVRSFAQQVRVFANGLATRGPIALRYAKEAILAGLDLTLDQGMRLEEDLYVLLQTTADRAEGVRAFLEKRSPEFKGS